MARQYQLSLSIVRCLLILVASLLQACNSVQNTSPTITVVPGPTGQYTGTTWIGDWLVIALQPLKIENGFQSRIWRLRVDGRDAEQLSLPERTECRRQGFELPTRLSNQQIGYIVRCLPQRDAREDLYMMAYNIETQQASSLLTNPLPSPQTGTGGFSWNSTMSRGITSDGRGRGISEQLYWLTPHSYDPCPVGFPIAYDAHWAPDDQAVAFVAAPEQGLSDLARLDSKYNLYVMNADGTNIHPIITNFQYPNGLTWSSDGHWIVMSATFGTLLKESGLWLIDMRSGTRQLITKGRFASPVWAPQQQKFVAIRYTGNDPTNLTSEIVIMDLEKIITSN